MARVRRHPAGTALGTGPRCFRSTCRQITLLKIVGVRVSKAGGSGDTPGTESVQGQVATSAAEAASLRGTAARRVVGAPLVGVLRTLHQRTRVAALARTSRAPLEKDLTGQEVTRPTPVAACVVPAAAVLETGEDGRATWSFPETFSGRPVVTAAAVDPEPDDDERTAWATLEQVTSWCFTVRVWCSRPLRGEASVAAPAAEGGAAHLTATQQSG